MKNKIENINTDLQKEIVKGETTEVMETVLFTDIVKKEIKSTSPLKYSEYLSLIAIENKIRLLVTPTFIFGRKEDIEMAQNKLITSVMYN